MNRPPANESPEAVALRHAAIAWAKYEAPAVGDPEDRKGAALNRRLLKAAVAYAAVAEGRPTAAWEAAERGREQALTRKAARS